MTKQRWATQVSGLAIAGQGLAYLLGIVLARNLDAAGFEIYVVASAAFILMVAVVPQGLEKYSLRVVPPLLEQAQWSPLLGYIRFSARRTLWAAGLVATAVGLWAWNASDFSRSARVAMVISCATVPLGAIVHLGLELLTAMKRPVAATVIFRLAVPAVALLGAAVVILSSGTLDGPRAVACWSVAWAAGLALMAAQIWRAAPSGLWSTRAQQTRTEWLGNARPFWVYRTLLAIFAQVGVLVLDRLQPSPVTVGAFAVAASTAALAQVLATATNRGYASRLSLLLDRKDLDGIHVLQLQRLQWLAPPLLAYVILAFAFSHELVGFFGPAFIEEGVPALRILVPATALSVILSLGPTYAKFRGRRKKIYLEVVIAAVVQIALLTALVPAHGATGAALAYAIGASIMYGRLAWFARNDLLGLRASARQD